MEFELTEKGYELFQQGKTGLCHSYFHVLIILFTIKFSHHYKMRYPQISSQHMDKSPSSCNRGRAHTLPPHSIIFQQSQFVWTIMPISTNDRIE